MKWMGWAAILVLAGCGGSPPPRVYVLNPPVDPVPRASLASGRPVLELQRVTVPDYLDSTDMMVRDGRNELKVSTTGRWGERLSRGVEDTLETALDHRLPGYLIVHRSSAGDRPVRHLLVDVDAFDIRADGTCVLTARWTLLGGDRRTIIARRDSFVSHAAVTGGGISDAAQAATMAAAVEQLANSIATAILRAPKR
jgi:uncharacterized lipoprotein YmbA